MEKERLEYIRRKSRLIIKAINQMASQEFDESGASNKWRVLNLIRGNMFYIFKAAQSDDRSLDFYTSNALEGAGLAKAVGLSVPWLWEFSQELMAANCHWKVVTVSQLEALLTNSHIELCNILDVTSSEYCWRNLVDALDELGEADKFTNGLQPGLFSLHVHRAARSVATAMCESASLSILCDLLKTNEGMEEE